MPNLPKDDSPIKLVSQHERDLWTPLTFSQKREAARQRRLLLAKLRREQHKAAIAKAEGGAS